MTGKGEGMKAEQWKPIDSVPKSVIVDVEKILVSCDDGTHLAEWSRSADGYSVKGGWFDCIDRYHIFPTHWMRVPQRKVTADD